MKFIIVAVMLTLVILAISAPIWLSGQRRQDAAEFDRTARWEIYSHPVGVHFRDYEVGCQIELSSGVRKYSVRRWNGAHPTWDVRIAAESEAVAKAAEFNETSWRP